jgi:hypothetical protein
MKFCKIVKKVRDLSDVFSGLKSQLYLIECLRTFVFNKSPDDC